MTNPLDARLQSNPEGAGVYMYYLKVIPTNYINPKGVQLQTNQYSVMTQFRAAVVNGVRQNVLPGLFFVYDISPFMVTVTEAYTTSVLQVVTSLCAILGGVITAAKLVDLVLYRLQTAMKGAAATGAGGLAGGAVTAQAAVTDALRSMQQSAGAAAASSFYSIASAGGAAAGASPHHGHPSSPSQTLGGTSAYSAGGNPMAMSPAGAHGGGGGGGGGHPARPSPPMDGVSASKLA
jgi:hypothetical protein